MMRHLMSLERHCVRYKDESLRIHGSLPNIGDETFCKRRMRSRRAACRFTAGFGLNIALHQASVDANVVKNRVYAACRPLSGLTLTV